MGKFAKERITRFKFFEHHVRSTTWYHHGKALPDYGTSRTLLLDPHASRESVSEAKLALKWEDLVILLVITWNELRHRRGVPMIQECELKRWRHAIGSADISDLLLSLRAGDDIILRYITDMEFIHSSYDRFKHDLRLEVPQIGARFFTLLQPLLRVVFVCEDVYDAMRDIRQALSFARKVTLTSDETELIRTAEEKFVQTDSQVYKGQASSYLRSFFTNHFADLPAPDQNYFRNGNGATYEVKRGNPLFSKDVVRRGDALLYANATALGVDLQIDPVRGWRMPLGLQRIARAHAVPKDCSKYRLICLEPTTLQWWQHACATVLWDRISQNAYLRTRICQRDESRNRDLCRLGSYDASYATIDLSNASDSVSWPLLRDALSACRNLSLMLEASRSQSVETTNFGLVNLNKFAGMGSCVTFPVECLLFSAICEEAIALCGESPLVSNYHVHGDDIVIETRFAEKTMELLAHYGFEVNRAKSYYKVQPWCNFRESCGVEYLDGISLSPVRLPRNFIGFSYELKANPWPTQAIAIANACFMELSDVRAYIVNQLLRLPKKLRPLFVPIGKENGIISTNPTNFHLKRCGWMSTSLQTKAYYHGACHTRQRGLTDKQRQEGYDISRYLEWLRLFAAREDESCEGVTWELLEDASPRAVSSGYAPRDYWLTTSSTDPSD